MRLFSFLPTWSHWNAMTLSVTLENSAFSPLRTLTMRLNNLLRPHKELPQDASYIPLYPAVEMMMNDARRYWTFRTVLRDSGAVKSNKYDRNIDKEISFGPSAFNQVQRSHMVCSKWNDSTFSNVAHIFLFRHTFIWPIRCAIKEWSLATDSFARTVGSQCSVFLLRMASRIHRALREFYCCAHLVWLI